jgi:hypothetical protein
MGLGATFFALLSEAWQEARNLWPNSIKSEYLLMVASSPSSRAILTPGFGFEKLFRGSSWD